MQYFPYWRPGNGSFRLKEEEHEQRYEDAEIEWFVTMQFLYMITREMICDLRSPKLSVAVDLR